CIIVPAAVTIATGNPVGLIVVGGAKLYGAASGRSGLEGRAKATADEIAAQLKIRFQDRGWIRSQSTDRSSSLPDILTPGGDREGAYFAPAQSLRSRAIQHQEARR